MTVGAAQWPPLSIDAAQFRSMLDELRTAIARPAVWTSGASALSLGLDRSRVLDGLCSLFAGLDAVDLDARRVLPPPSVSSGNPTETVRLRDLLSSLSSSLRHRVTTQLGAEKVESVRRLLQSAAPDFLGLLERTDDENENSKVLRWLLDPRTAPNIGPGTLLGLARHLDDADKWRSTLALAIRLGSVSVRREFVFGREWSPDASRDRIDLVVSGPGFMLAIENKLWSPEHDGQTSAYWAWLETLKEPLRGGLFLTPAGTPPACPAFKAVSYLDLLSCLLETSVRTPTEEFVLSGYLRTLAARVLRVEIAAAEGRGGS